MSDKECWSLGLVTPDGEEHRHGYFVDPEADPLVKFYDLKDVADGLIFRAICGRLTIPEADTVASRIPASSLTE